MDIETSKSFDELLTKIQKTNPLLKDEAFKIQQALRTGCLFQQSDELEFTLTYESSKEKKLWNRLRRSALGWKAAELLHKNPEHWAYIYNRVMKYKLPWHLVIEHLEQLRETSGYIKNIAIS